MSHLVESQAVEQLAHAAGALAKQGRWQEAEATWQQVYQLAPDHAQALSALGIHARQRGDLKLAKELLDKASRVAGKDLLVLLTLINARSGLGDPADESSAIDQALAVDAYFLPALIAKGQFIEKHGEPTAAASMWANVLKVAPPESHWPEKFRPQLQHARKLVQQHARAFSAYLDEQLAPLQSRLTSSEAERWRESASIMAGLSKPYHVDCNQLHVARLPAIPFYDRKLFPWASSLEAKTAVIRTELQQALKTAETDFQPYITYKPGDPVNQWQELNHSRRWSTYALWSAGDPVQEHLERCPETTKALQEIEMADIAGLCPNAMFSALAPHTQIPPHHGETNARLVVHLPLIVPEGCSYRVGFERRQWKVGELLIFDDTIEHEARNDSDELRVVLIFDVWNPLLSTAERDMVQAMTSASRSFASKGQS